MSASRKVETLHGVEMKPAGAALSEEERRKRGLRAYWMRTMIQWHWISSAICLVGMLLFAVTGITLNHAGEISSEPTVATSTAQLPSELIKTLNAAQVAESGPLPDDVSRWLSKQLSTPIGRRAAEWSESEVYLSMPGPGVDAWVSIDRETGEVEFESTDRGWIAYFNDLHKGRHTGVAWKWFIDVFAVATLVFCLTGLGLLYLHGRHRPMTWPMVALGLVIPALIAMLIAHFP